MKKIVSLILALSMVLSMFSFSFAASKLSDVTGTKYEAAVEALMELGVVDGYPDETFLPDNVVTRAELTKLLVTAYGLNQAAEVASGVTPFSDVAGNWAAGYINVSADYKFINGYPDGTFKPNETVTYAEAITMCLRVLGYANEVDSKGTWPTNYIAKAQDLKLMKDLDYTSYNDGAKRGNVALLIWNMLRTKMWTVVGESEGDGLESRAENEMLNVKFSDYAYSKNVEFKGFTIGSDSKKNVAKVEIELGKVNGKDYTLDATKYEYAKNDFYTFVPGTEVEVLVNEEDGELLSIVPSGSDTLVEGTKEDIDDTYDELLDVDYQYAYSRVESKKLVSPVTLNGESIFVDKLEDKKESVKINKKSYNDSDWDTELILKDGERVALRDISEGDILTEVTVNYGKTEAGVFYVIGGTEVEGKLTRHVTDKYEDSKVEYVQIIVGGDEYTLDKNVTYVVDPSKENVTTKEFYKSNTFTDNMKGEIVTLRLDPIFGRVVRVEFDGKLDGGSKSTDGKFFGIAGKVVEREANIYTIDLLDENGSDTYTFANSTLGKKVDNMTGDSDISGSLVYVKFNSNDEIVEFEIVAQAKADEEINTKLTTKETKYAYDDGAKDYYGAYVVEDAEVDEDDGEYKIQANNKDVIDLDEKTVVVTLTFNENDEDSVNDDEYTIEFEEGVDSIAKLNGEDIIVIYDADADEPTAKYVVIARDGSTTSDEEVAIVKSVKADGYVALTTDADEKGTQIYNASKENLDEQDVIVYTTKEDDEETEVKKVVSRLTDIADDDFAYVSKVGTKYVTIDGDEINMKSSDYRNEYEKYKRFVLVEVSLYDDDEFEEVSHVEMLDDFDAVVAQFEEFDRVAVDETNKTYYLIKGFAEIEEPEKPKTASYKVTVMTRDSEDAEYVEADSKTSEGVIGEAAVYSRELEGYTFDSVNPENAKIAENLEVKVYFTKVAEDPTADPIDNGSGDTTLDNGSGDTTPDNGSGDRV